MACPTAISPTLLLLLFSTLSLSSAEQFPPQKQAIASPFSASSAFPNWATTESSIPFVSELPSYLNNKHAQIPALITGVKQAGLLPNRDVNPTITIAQSTRTTLTNKITNDTAASKGFPTKSANGTGSATLRVGNATVLPPEPVFTTRGTKSEAGSGMGMGMRMRMGGVVVVGMGVWGVMVLL